MNVLYEDAELVAVAKPSGIPVIPARDEPPEESLQHQLAIARGERLWVVHRIDRETSGVVVFARTADAHRALNTAFETRKVDKTYLALAAGALDGDAGLITRIDVPLHEARRGKARPAEASEPGAKHAVTELAVERRWRHGDGVISRVRCHPITGRHHQIRVHLRWANAPILRDPLYGKATGRGALAEVPCPRLALHAASLTVPGPRTFTAPLPEDLAAVEAWLDAHWEAA